jgi:superfamily II DNA or RNA helicase
MIRAYVSLLQSGYAIESDAEARDPYWTLVGYFNSLRVLGGARMQVQDDVREQLPLVARDEGARELEPDNRIELTSRENSADIPSHLARMAVRLPDRDTLDVILATNMISVGVDIDRLGLMAMMGQPQSASEYIQATSRVGRAYPGLVVTLLNAARSRDRSHYEAFKTFHSALYRQVESTSVTPFSPRSRDRGLHAVLVALARITIPDLAENGSAGQVGAHRAEIELLIEKILERVRSVDPVAEAASRVQLERTLSEWESRAVQVSDLRYVGFRETLDQALLISAADADKAQLNMFPTLWSLRDVDQESNLYLTRGG